MPSKRPSKGSAKSLDDTHTSSGNALASSNDKLLFSGLCLYFFPNSRTNRARALRIDRAVQNGAVFCQSFNTRVTHVVMDDGMAWSEFTKYHKDCPPVGQDVPVVNGRYIADCLAFGIVLATIQSVYQVPGRLTDGEERNTVRRIASEPDLMDKTSNVKKVQLKRSITDQAMQGPGESREPTQEYNSIVELIGRAAKATQNFQAQKPTMNYDIACGDSIYEDELSAMIVEAKATAHLPIESFVGNRPLYSSLPGPSLAYKEPEPASPTILPEASNCPTTTSESPVDPMIMRRPSDGALVKVRCKECGESQFGDMKAFLKHCAFRHRYRFKTQAEAIEQWGFPLGPATTPSKCEKLTPTCPPIQPIIQGNLLEVTSPGAATQERPSKRAKTSWQEQFICMDKHDKETKQENPNAFVIEKLQEMADFYERTGDRWRTLSFRKGVNALKRQEKQIRTKEEALKLPNVGESIAEAIEKIVQTGKLRRLDATKEDPANQFLQLFMGIYGVGLAQATKWVQAGYKSLDELQEKAQLSDNQRIGLLHYDDLQQRVPRTEVEKHGDIFKRTLSRIDGLFEVTIGGSYRRGSPTSGDIDLIITKPGADLHQIRIVILDQVVPELFKLGFLKAELARTSSETGSKWHGCSAVDDGPWRRIDLLLVPWDEMGAALIYFTGNDIFNRSIRLLASRKGMRLNQRGLYKEVLRGKGREKVTDGELLESKCERRIFEILEVPWRPPHHRNC